MTLSLVDLQALNGRISPTPAPLLPSDLTAGLPADLTVKSPAKNNNFPSSSGHGHSTAKSCMEEWAA